MELIFTARGYDFYRHPTKGYWNCAPQGSPAPSPAGGYGLVSSLAKLKGILPRDLPEKYRNA